MTDHGLPDPIGLDTGGSLCELCRPDEQIGVEPHRLPVSTGFTVWPNMHPVELWGMPGYDLAE
jgi:hypothetical protein